MPDVVLDEWILIRGLAAERRFDAYELEAAELLSLVQRDHRWIFTRDIVSVYEQRLYAVVEKGALWMRVRASFQACLVSQERGLWLYDVPEVVGPYHHKDRRWISAAAAAPAGCIFVTGDRRLLKQLDACDVPEKGGFTARFVTDGLT